MKKEAATFPLSPLDVHPANDYTDTETMLASAGSRAGIPNEAG